MLPGEVEVSLWQRCEVAECGGARSEPAEACLKHLPSGELDRHLRRFSRGRPLEARGTEIDSELLARVLDAAPTDPLGRRRLSGARFDGAVFGADLDLDGTWFGQDASFHGARFTGTVSMRDARVLRQASFGQAIFEGAARFDGASLEGPAVFTAAQFQGGASFQGATFGGTSWFTSSDFTADGVFRDSQFARHTSFKEAMFGCHGDFTGATFDADVEFVDARFANPPQFEGSSFKGRDGVPEVASRKEVKWWGPPLATWKQRAAAAGIDLAVPVVLVVAGLVTTALLRALHHGDAAEVLTWLGPIAALGYVVRNCWIQGESGQSWGKRRTGLRLIDERDRMPPGPIRSLVRQLLHVVDVLGVVSWFLVRKDEKRQTIADRVLGTVVVVVGEQWHRANRDDAPAAAAQAAGFG